MSELLVQDTSLNAVANAIREKTKTTGGITFPSGFIDAIATLSEMPHGITAMEVVEYTPVSDTTSGYLNLTHTLGTKPNFIFGFKKNGTKQSDVLNWIIHTGILDGSGNMNGAYFSGSGNTITTFSVSPYTNASAKFRAANCSNTCKLLAGTTYVWYVGVIEGLG